ncbi:MAG: tyrosinase family protein [Acidobacteriota bacterium]
MAVRKNALSLTPAERTQFTDAVRALKREVRPGASRNSYDEIVLMHRRAMSQATPPGGNPGVRNSAHRGPAFLPWHREFLRRFERGLQRVSNNPNLGLPYWDWAADAPNTINPRVWSADLLGGDGQAGNVVRDGPFRFNPADPANSWVIVDGNGNPAGGLQRRLGQGASLAAQSDIDAALLIPTYDVSPWDVSSSSGFRNTLEGWIGSGRLHNAVHAWVGGSMLPGTSPNDPVFFLHHCFVDLIWFLWQQQHGVNNYLPTSPPPTGHALNTPMFPWNSGGDQVTPADTLDITDSRNGFSYDHPSVQPTASASSAVITSDWVQIRPLISAWPAGGPPPTFEILSPQNGSAIVELAWDPQAMLAPANYPDPLRYYSSDIDLDESISRAGGGQVQVRVPPQTIPVQGGRGAWTLPAALWNGYQQETLRSLGSSSATLFNRVLYYRVRLQPTASQTALVWPPDSEIIQSGRHLTLLPQSRGAAQPVPDQAALRAMGRIPNTLVSWGDVLAAVWNALPSNNPDRRSLARIFGNDVFRNEINTDAVKGKILMLWLFGGPSRRRLHELLDRRVRVGSNLTAPIITQLDLKQQKTLVDNLLSMLAITPHPDIAGTPTASELVDDVITEVLDPNGQINQGRASTCTTTSTQTFLLSLNPSEYARLQVSLLSSTGRVELADGTRVTVPPAIFQVTRYSSTPPFVVRTNSELGFQATVLKHGLGASFPSYNPASPPNSATGVNTVFRATVNRGLTSSQFDRVLEGIFSEGFFTSAVGASAATRDAFLNDFVTLRQPMALALYWVAAPGQPGQGGHAVLVVRRENGRVYFKNPQYTGSSPTSGITQGGNSTTAGGTVHNFPPRRFDDPSAALESMTESDLANWILWYHRQNQVVG